MADQYIRLDHRGMWLYVEVIEADYHERVSEPQNQDDDDNEEITDLAALLADTNVTTRRHDGELEMSLEERLDQMMLDPNEPLASEQQQQQQQTDETQAEPASSSSNTNPDAEELALSAALELTSLDPPRVIYNPPRVIYVDLRPIPEHIRIAVTIPSEDRTHAFTVEERYIPESVVRAVTHLDAFAGYDAEEIIAFLRAQRVFLTDEAIVRAMIREYGLGF